MVNSSYDKLTAMLKTVRAHGWSRNLNASEKKILKISNSDEFYDQYKFHYLGFNLRPTEINGYLGNIQINNLSKIIIARKNNFNFLRSRFNYDLCYDIFNNQINKLSNFAFPVVFKKNVDIPTLSSKLNKLNIENRPIIAGNITRHDFYSKFFKKFNLKNADHIHKNGLYIPNHEGLSKSDLIYILDCFNKIL